MYEILVIEYNDFFRNGGLIKYILVCVMGFSEGDGFFMVKFKLFRELIYFYF